VIVNNSGWKIQTQTDSLIQTFNSTGGSTRPGYTITKTAVGNGPYEIALTGSCDSLVPSVPTIPTGARSFHERGGCEAGTLNDSKNLRYVYATGSKMIQRVILPDNDSELAAHHFGPGVPYSVPD
jgi:hypothetical protein